MGAVGTVRGPRCQGSGINRGIAWETDNKLTLPVWTRLGSFAVAGPHPRVLSAWCQPKGLWCWLAERSWVNSSAFPDQSTEL